MRNKQCGEIVLLIFTILLIGIADAEGQKKEQPNKSLFNQSYFPIDVGYEWIYASDDGDVTFEVTGREKVGKTECFVVKRSIGRHSVKFYISTSADGVRIHRVGDDVYKPPFLQFKFLTKSGDTWNSAGELADKKYRYDCLNYGKSEITVPLGTFKTFYVANFSDEGNAYYHLVKGIGVVSIRQKKSDEHDPIKGPFTWKLKKFTKPSDRRK